MQHPVSNISPGSRIGFFIAMHSSGLYAKTVFKAVHEESFLRAESVKPPPPLHLRLPAVAELAAYVFREYHAGAVLLFSVRALPCFF